MFAVLLLNISNKIYQTYKHIITKLTKFDGHDFSVFSKHYSYLSHRKQMVIMNSVCCSCLVLHRFPSQCPLYLTFLFLVYPNEGFASSSDRNTNYVIGGNAKKAIIRKKDSKESLESNEFLQLINKINRTLMGIVNKTKRLFQFRFHFP